MSSKLLIVCSYYILITIINPINSGKITRSSPLRLPICASKLESKKEKCMELEMFHFESSESANFSVFPDDYQRQNKPPTVRQKPLEVKIAISIITILGLDETNKDITLEVMLTVEWRDIRLFLPKDMPKDQYVHLHPSALEECLWIPDAYMYYLKELKTSRLLTSSGSLVVDSDNHIIYSCQMLLQIGCYMDFSLYPVDTQECTIRLASYSHSSDDLLLIWDGPMVLKETVYLDEFEFDYKTSRAINKTSMHKDDIPMLEVILVFHRFLSFHLLQTYLPSSLLVVVAWLSLFVPRELVPGRMLLCMTTLITLTTMLIAVREMGPRCSYLKAIDIWMMGCILFVFFSLSQYALVLRWDDAIKEANKRVETMAELISKSMDTEEDKLSTLNKISRVKDDYKMVTLRRNLTIDRVEVYCIIIYPVLFAIFNLIYWSWILSQK